MSFFKFARDLTRVVLMPLFRVKYHNVENVPKQGGYILAPNHRMALDPLFVSYRIPQDIAIVGFDNMPICTYIEPTLTTIHVPKQYMGRMAVQRLHERICNSDSQPIKLEISTTLQKRKSC